MSDFLLSCDFREKTNYETHWRKLHSAGISMPKSSFGERISYTLVYRQTEM